MFRIERVGRRLGFIAIGGVVALVIACGGSGDDAAADQPADTLPTPAVAPSPTATPDPVPTVTPEESTVEPSATDATSSEVEPTSTARPELQIEDDAERSRAEWLRSIWGWGTDFNKRTIALNELKIGLPRDRIASIVEPTFLSVSNPPDYMDPREPVVAVIVNGEAKAYPLAMLMWHEIVNDTIGGIPVTVTFCPLCNTGITFERIVDGRELMFGTSGMLRNSDLVMWDR
jgi:hypothetical protein